MKKILWLLLCLIVKINAFSQSQTQLENELVNLLNEYQQNQIYVEDEDEYTQAEKVNTTFYLFSISNGYLLSTGRVRKNIRPLNDDVFDAYKTYDFKIVLPLKYFERVEVINGCSFTIRTNKAGCVERLRKNIVVKDESGLGTRPLKNEGSWFQGYTYAGNCLPSSNNAVFLRFKELLEKLKSMYDQN